MATMRLEVKNCGSCPCLRNNVSGEFYCFYNAKYLMSPFDLDAINSQCPLHTEYVDNRKDEPEWIHRIPEEGDGLIDFKSVERALGFRLFAWQKSYILCDKFRRMGATTAQILRDLLTKTEDRPLDYSNYGMMDRKSKLYIQQTHEIWEKLRDAKIKMRPVLWNKEDKKNYYEKGV